MRHASIETTLRYCVDQDADDVADELWKTFDSDPCATPGDFEVKKQDRASEC
ncbi:MAG: hypothetical protein GXX96_31055 [Planctomycetaceae bacterium]|jgi:hypothetical protein|nr:hypothetical protein [Planctomycetaceae bacterium]